MSVETKLTVRGLARDPSAFAADAAGLLRRAENIVVRSEGVAESRPNFDLLREDTGSDTSPRSLFDFGGSVVSIESDGTFTTWKAKTEIGTLTPPIAGAWQPPNYDPDETSFAKSRGNLYLSGLFGPVALEGASGPGRFCGIDMRLVMDPWSGAFVTPVLGGLRYAYRLVFVRKDSHGYIRRSPPSERFILDGLMAAGMTITIPVSQMVAGDQVEIYRSLASATSATSPRPEHYLANTYTLTSANIISSSFTSVADTVADADLGAELYTDSSQDGAASAKFRPPSGAHLAWWARCMWYGRTAEASRYTLTMKTLGRAGNPVYWDDTGWTFTVGLNTATATRTAGIFVGMYVTGENNIGPELADTYIPANTQVTAIAGSTITLSNVALANGSETVLGYEFSAPDGLAAYNPVGTGTIGTASITSGVDTKFFRPGMWFWTNPGGVPTRGRILSITDSSHFVISVNLAANMSSTSFWVGDVLTINGVDFLYGSGDATGFGDGTPGAFGVPDQSLGRSRIGVVMDSLAMSIQTYAFIHPSFRVNAQIIGDRYKDPSHPVASTRDANGMWPWPGTVPVSIELEEGAPDGSSFRTSIALSGTCPNAWTPVLGSSDSTIRPNRVFFSDLDEPEAVPLVNFLDIGLLDEPIQSLVTLRDCLLVFKTDGLWRITGSGPSSWSVEQVDTTLRLVNPQSVAVMNGIAYAWCDRGFFAVDESSATSLSADLIDVELRAVVAFVLNQPRSHGVFVATWRQRNIVLLGVPSGNIATACAKVYCYSVTTQQWSEWPVTWNTAASAFYGDTVYVARASAVDEIRSGIAPRGYDREYAIADAAWTATSTSVLVQVADIGAWLPSVGDFIGATVGPTTTYRRILAVTPHGSPITSYTLTIEAVVAGADDASFTAREGASIVMEWHPHGPAGVPVGAICRELQPQIDIREGVQTTTVTTPRYVGGASSETTPTPATLVSNKPRSLAVQPLRFGASRQVARGANIAPYFETSDIFPIRVNGMSVVFEGTSERTRR